MSATHVSLIVTRHSRILTSVQEHDETDFADGNVALQYAHALNQWIRARPTGDNIGTWQPPVIQVPVDQASQQASQLPRLLFGRDPELFPKDLWPDTDPEHIASRAEHRPYDVEREAA